MFILLIVTLILWILFAAGGYVVGKEFPKTGVVIAGIVAGLLGALWWYVLEVDVGHAGAGSGLGQAILTWLSMLPVLFVVGLISGACAQPELAIAQTPDAR